MTIYREITSNQDGTNINGDSNHGTNLLDDGNKDGGYELYYRISSSPSEGVSSSSSSGPSSSSSLSNDWQVKPVFFPSNLGQLVGKGRNETIVLLDNLICGTTYHVHVVDLESGSRSETVTFRTQGSGKKTFILYYLVSNPTKK